MRAHHQQIHPALVFGPLLPKQVPRSSADWLLHYIDGRYVDDGVPACENGARDAA